MWRRYVRALFAAFLACMLLWSMLRVRTREGMDAIFDGPIEDWYRSCSEMCVEGNYHRRTRESVAPIVAHATALENEIDKEKDRQLAMLTSTSDQDKCKGIRNKCLVPIRKR